MVKRILKLVRQGGNVGLLTAGIFLLAESVSAEPQFGGDVSGVIRCTCDENAGGVHFIVGDPHGDENGNMTAYVAPPGVEMDCALIIDGEETLGMHTDEDTECKIQVGNACILVATGKKVEYFGSSPATCDTGLEGDASGDGKTEMMTPDGRTADGGDDDDGGPSGGPSNATQSDTHLTTVDGVKGDGSNASDMITPDNQNDEGGNTTKMTTAPTGRKEDGTNSSVFTSSGAGDGYSPGGAGIGGEGYGSVGGSVGSGGLQSPVVLGEQDQAKKELKRKNNTRKKLNIKNSYDIQKATSKEIMLKLLIVIGGIGGAGYFVFRSIKKVLN